ncbi:universal stress protein [Paeniglutamicibacter sp. ZC-3]|uniref:universal stress protein n=1 Tax=Paeniglutamicibacter sp. ZC-3 TaxID=2986919 RepID=UPI0021F778BE|nr:universal stress protein [Paeniglutamicibacter sp. ZC-3]MCV9992745.1 universal stress protein [Paeniglutamicibacter sp. ZC-3]
MSPKGGGTWGPLIVGVIPRQHPEVISHGLVLAEQLDRAMIFAYVETNSYLTEWNLQEDIRDLSLHPRDLDEDMTADALEILAVVEARMEGSSTVWTLRILAGEIWKALARLASETDASMIIVGTRKPTFGAHVSQLLNGATASHLAAHQHRPVLVVPSMAKPKGRRV